jgi:hypothetical protein
MSMQPHSYAYKTRSMHTRSMHTRSMHLVIRHRLRGRSCSLISQHMLVHACAHAPMRPCSQLYSHLNTVQQTKHRTHLDAVEDDGSAAHGLESAHGRRHATGHDFLWKQERMVKKTAMPHEFPSTSIICSVQCVRREYDETAGFVRRAQAITGASTACSACIDNTAQSASDNPTAGVLKLQE